MTTGEVCPTLKKICIIYYHEYSKIRILNIEAESVPLSQRSGFDSQQVTHNRIKFG